MQLRTGSPLFSPLGRRIFPRPSSLLPVHTIAVSTAAATMASSASSSSYQPVLTVDSINPHVPKVEYAVRGELSNRANDYANILAEGKGKEKNLAFPSVVSANIGNPQQQPFLAQKPITFWRQVAALTEYPALLESKDLPQDLFPKDVQERARHILDDVGSVGAYSHSKGAASIRKHVAKFIEGEEENGLAIISAFSFTGKLLI